MNRLLIVITFILNHAAWGASSTVVIEADDFLAGTNIHNYFDGLIIYGKQIQGLDKKAYAVNSTGCKGLLGQHVIGYFGAPQEYWTDSPHLRIEFYKKAKSVTISAVGAYGVYQVQGMFTIYDSNDKIIARRYWTPKEYEVFTYTLSASNYIVAYAEVITSHAICIDHIVAEISDHLDPICSTRPAMDFDGDCRVNFADFAIFAATWMECGLIPEEACLF